MGHKDFVRRNPERFASICYIYRKWGISTRTGAVHSPTLDTIRMVGSTAVNTAAVRCRSLPRKVMYQTFRTIIEYLLESGKIAIDARGRVCWIYDPEFTRWYLAREDLRVK